jgi:hypothetical protein
MSNVFYFISYNNHLKEIHQETAQLIFPMLPPNPSFNPDVASVSHFPHDPFGILISSRRAASATPVNSPR